MTDLKRRNLVAALGAAPFVLPVLTAAQSVGTGSKFKVIPSRDRIRDRYFPNLSLTTQEGAHGSFLRRPRQRQDRDLQYVLCEM